MKTFLTAIVLLLNASSFAQIIAAEGFFDTDPGVGNGLAMNIAPNGSVTNFSSALPANISPGMHSLYVRTCAASHLWSVAKGRLVYIDQSAYLPPQVLEVDQCEYFIGNDPGVGNGTAVPITVNASEASITQSILTSLAPGFYTIALRFRASGHLWSVPRTRTFYVREVNDNQVADEIVEAEYFIGTTDPGAGSGSPLPLEAVADPTSFLGSAATSLDPGIYLMSVRFKSSAGLWSDVRTRYFNVIQTDHTTLAESIVSAEYFVDSDPGVGQGIAVNLDNPGETVQIAHEALISAGYGMHTLYLRTRSDRQLWSVPVGRIFLVTDDPVYPVNEIVYAEYYIDTDPGEGNATAMAIVSGSIVPLDGSIPTTGLNPGQHTLYTRVRSDLGLWSEISSQNFVITSDTPVFEIDAIAPLCNGESSGQIQVALFGGSGEYTYTWDGVVGTPVLNNVEAGDYHLVVTNAEDVVVLDSLIVVDAPEILSYTSTVTSTSCNGATDGSALVVPDGGTGDLNIDWNGNDPQNLGAGTYLFIITDENNCILDGSVTIMQPDPLTASSAVVPTTTDNSCDGSITVSPAGGTAPYSYAWTPSGPDAPENTGLCTGTYSVEITDANGCTTSLSGVLITVGVDDDLLSGLEISATPNPGDGNFRITLQTSLPLAMSWQVVDNTGRVVKASEGLSTVSGQTSLLLDLTAESNGIYHLNLLLNGQPVSLPLMIAR